MELDFWDKLFILLMVIGGLVVILGFILEFIVE